MATITPISNTPPLRFRINVEPGQRAVASLGLFSPKGDEISHRFVSYSEGTHELSIDEIFTGLDRPGLSVTYVIGEEGIEYL
jgi:hypothetical protein